MVHSQIVLASQFLGFICIELEAEMFKMLGRSNDLADVREFRATLPRQLFAEFAKKDRLQVLRELRDGENQGSNQRQAYEEMIATETANRAAAQRAAELAAQSRESELRHFRTAALFRGPLLRRRIWWKTVDILKTIAKPFSRLWTYSNVLFWIGIVLSTIGILAFSINVESGSSVIYLLAIVVMLIGAVIVTDNNNPKTDLLPHFYDYACVLVSLALAGSLVFLQFPWPSAGYWAMVVSRDNQVIRVEQYPGMRMVPSPKLSDTVEWFDLRAHSHGGTYELKKANLYVDVLYEVRIRIEALQQGHKPTDAQLTEMRVKAKSIINEIGDKEGVTTQELRTIPSRVSDISNPVYEIVRPRLGRASYDLSK